MIAIRARDEPINYSTVPGTLLAIVWKVEATRKQRSAAFKRVSKSQGLSATELKGEKRKESLADFFKGGWFRGAEVDRLSEEEAGIMAGRLIRKIRRLIAVTDEQAKTLRDDFTQNTEAPFDRGVGGPGVSAGGGGQGLWIRYCLKHLFG